MMLYVALTQREWHRNEALYAQKVQSPRNGLFSSDKDDVLAGHSFVLMRSSTTVTEETEP